MARYCTQCDMHGHSKWLFLGTHRTHRLYIRFRMWETMRELKREGRRRGRELRQEREARERD